MWGPRLVAKLVNITPITMVYDTQVTTFNGVYKPTYNWRGSHCTLQKGCDSIQSNNPRGWNGIFIIYIII